VIERAIDLVPGETALLLIDVQNYVLDPPQHTPQPAFYPRLDGSACRRSDGCNNIAGRSESKWYSPL
jgi:hypothetical protein